MKKAICLRNLLAAIALTAVLVCFMLKTPSPKIIFVPFLVCSCAFAAENLALLLQKERLAAVCHKLFAAGFFLFWFGFLVVAAVLALRKRQYSLLVLSLPFWAVGLRMAKGIFFPNRAQAKQEEKATRPPVAPPVLLGAGLVAAALAVGVVVLVLGLHRGSLPLAFFGGFFLLGALAFVLAALTKLGKLKGFKADLLGIYLGGVLALAGLGTLALKFAEAKTLSSFGLWIVVPPVMIAGGILAVVQGIRGRKK